MGLNKFISLVVLLISSFGSTYASDLSIGISGGQSYFNNLENACLIGSCLEEETDTTIGVNLAYGFNDVWGLEIGYIDFGTSSLTGSIFTGGFNLTRYLVEIDSSAVYLAGTATANFTNKLSLTGRLGIASLDLDISSDNIVDVTVEDTDEEPFGSVSLDYGFTQALSIGLRFDVIRDVAASTIALKANF